jgi:hypothetical protein
MGFFSPVYGGAIEMETIPSDFTDRIERRVESGLFIPGSRSRANYVVCNKEADEIRFMANDFVTAYNVGLNDVVLKRSGQHTITYRGKFWRWAIYAAAQALVIATLILLALLAAPGARDQISSYRFGWVYIGVLLVFFGLIWPWILVALQRRFAPRALERIVRQAIAA